MNHLRELIDLVPHGISAHAGIRQHVHKGSFVSTFQSEAPKAVCFWCGDFYNTLDRQIIPELCRLPFNEVWLEFTIDLGRGRQGLLGALVGTDLEPGSVYLMAFIKYANRWQFEFICIGLNMETGVSRANKCDDEMVMLLMQRTVHVVRAFCSTINCQNVHRKEHKPNTALQKARAKRGKQPLFSYWTLELNGRDGGAAQSFGGTHASPRVHLRRGHPRQYAPGKWTWVQPCAVGNRELGMVHKDYVIGKEMVAH